MERGIIDFAVSIVQGLDDAISNFSDDVLLEEYSCSVQMNDNDLFVGSLLSEFLNCYKQLFEQEIIRRFCARG